MCFSAAASFTAAVPLSAVGGATLTKVKKKSQVPFALIPLLFALQQALEGTVWLTFGNVAWQFIHIVATYAYSIFAYVFWPVFLPFAIRLLEPVEWRRQVMIVLQCIGLAVGIYLFYFMFYSHVTATIVHKTIVYNFYQPCTTFSIALYLIAGCLSFFFSSNKIINFLGALLTISLVITYYFYSTYVVSIWCFFSAILSGVVFFYLVTQKEKHAAKGRKK